MYYVENGSYVNATGSIRQVSLASSLAPSSHRGIMTSFGLVDFPATAI